MNTILERLGLGGMIKLFKRSSSKDSSKTSFVSPSGHSGYAALESLTVEWQATEGLHNAILDPISPATSPFTQSSPTIPSAAAETHSPLITVSNIDLETESTRSQKRVRFIEPLLDRYNIENDNDAEMYPVITR